MLKHHPDKNPDAPKDLANAKMRFLLAKKEMFLEP